jgi:HSP20 family protein
MRSIDAAPTRHRSARILTIVNTSDVCGYTVAPIRFRFFAGDLKQLRSTTMSMLTRWNPFRQSMRFDPLTDVDDLFRNLNLRPLLRDFETMPPEIRMDVREDDTSYRVIVDMPGVNKDDIEVSVEGNQVTIQGETKRQEERKTDKEIHSERYVGKCFRAFTLPREVDSEKCEASYDNGVLTLTLPKKGNGQSKRLPIQ